VRTPAHLLRGAARTDPGRVRTNNEDLPLMDAGRGIFGVIDGVGGEAGGEVAAATAHDVILQRLARPVGTPAERVREAIAIANNEIFRRAKESRALRGMACVITLALVADGRLTAGHVGDSRLYKIRPEGLRKLTRDHSPVGEREDAGELGEVDAMRHPRRNEVFRDVGSIARDKDEQDFVDIIEEPLEPDSAILLCSDGLSDMLTSSTMAHLVRQHAGDPERVVEALVAAANDAGGKDNVTAVYAEGPLFAEALGLGGASALTPTEPLGERPAAASPQTSRAGAGRETRSIVRSPVLWFAIGTLLGIVGALGLTYYVAQTQVPPPQTLVVSGADGSPFATIASAMAAARPGDIVRVEPGEYVEQVVVADGVDLLAREPGSVTISRPAPLDPSVAGVQAGGTQPIRISGIHLRSSPASPAAAGIAIAGAGVTLELMEISGPLTRAIVVLPDASVIVRGSRVAVAGAVLSVPDGSQATLMNNILTRAASSPEPAITAGPLSRLTLSGNTFSGFPPEIVRGVGDARRRELLTGNVIVAPPAPARSGRPPR
jgi:serine/threonine protein phosphatase PrpC